MGYMKDLATDIEEAIAAFESTSGTRLTAEEERALIERLMAGAAIPLE